MNRNVATIRLSGPNGQQVAVGIVIHANSRPKGEHFTWESKAHRLSLQADGMRAGRSPSQDLFLECMLSTVMGVYNFGRLYPKKFDYTFTLLEGRRLLRDASTSAGFYHAGFRAAANAIGFSPKRCDDELASSGWKQMDGAEEGPRKGGKSLASRIKKTKGRQRGHPLKTSYSRTKTTK